MRELAPLESIPLAHFGPGAVSDLSPLCAPERTFTNASRLISSRLTNPHCLQCGCSAQDRPVAPWLRQINPSGKLSLSPSGKSLLGLPPSCPRGRGVGHRHRTLGWDCGGRGGVGREVGSQGGFP
jgi:hypothetical protein